MADVKATQFISALVKNLQAVCHGHVDFDQNIKVVGHLFLTVDSGREFNYILNEKVSKTDQSSTTFVSRSFYATDPQPKPPPPTTLKPEPNNKVTIPVQRAQWQNEYYEGALGPVDQRQKPVLAQDSRPQTAQAQNRILHKRSPKPNLSSQPFAKVPKLSDRDSNIQRNSELYAMYNQGYEEEDNPDSRLSFSDGGMSPQMGGDSAGEEDYGYNLQTLQYSEVRIHGQSKEGVSVGNKVKVEPNQSVDSQNFKSKSAYPPTNIASSTPTPVSKASTSAVPTTSNNQVIDVDLTKVKEEPQDETFTEAEKAAYEDSQTWNQAQQEEYNEEGYGDEDYGGDSNDEEFLTALREKTIGLFPVGFARPADNKAVNQASMMGNQQFMNNQMMHQGAGQIVPSQSSGVGGRKPVTKIPCNYCGKFFSEATLTRHVQTQHLHIRIKCPICSHSFARKETLKKHMLKKHSMGGPPLEVSCPICEEAFASQDQVHKHIFDVHRVNPPIS